MSAGSIKRDEQRDTWYFVVDVPTPDGRRRQVRRRGFATRRAAQIALKQVEAAAENGELVSPSTITVRTFLVDHWLPAARTRVRQTTHDADRRIVDKHIVPRLGAVKVQRLERVHVARFLTDLAEAGLSPKTIRNVHSVLHRALAYAVKHDLAGRNVAAGVDLPRVDRPPVAVWSPAQLADFLDHVAGDRLAPLWRFLATTGARRGEALGLRWRDVDLDAGTVTIAWQRTIAGGTVVEGPPKTRSGERTIALDEPTVAAIRAWRRQQAAERLAMGTGWAERSGAVFTNPDGSPVWPQRVTRDFKRIADELGLPQIGVHGLRHSAATFWIATGQSPKLVQKRLGHADIAVTLRTYTHVAPAEDRAAADALAAALAAASGRRGVSR